MIIDIDRYVKTAAIKEAVEGHELAVLAALGIDWRPGYGHVDCPYSDHGGKADWRWDEGKRRAFCTCIGKRAGERRSHSIFDVAVVKEGIEYETAKIRVAQIIGRSDLIKIKGVGEGHQATDVNSLLSAPADRRDDSLPWIYLGHRLRVVPDRVPRPRTRVVGIKALGYSILRHEAGRPASRWCQPMRRRRTGQQCLHQRHGGKRPSHPIRRGAGDPMPTQFGPGTLEGAAEAGSGQTAVRLDATNRRDTASAITATEWRPLARNTLEGFLTLALPTDLRLQESSLHENDGHRWDPAGKGLYLAIVEIPDKTDRERFQAAALAALDEMLLGAAGEL